MIAETGNERAEFVSYNTKATKLRTMDADELKMCRQWISIHYTACDFDKIAAEEVGEDEPGVGLVIQDVSNQEGHGRRITVLHFENKDQATKFFHMVQDAVGKLYD